VAGTRFDRVHPRWSGRSLFHVADSPFRVPDDQLRGTSLGLLEEGQAFAFYLGHSGPAGLWSSGAPFLSRADFATMTIEHGTGVFFTCGCFGCQLAGRQGEGYGLAAMRNPNGPAAVIGAHGESYSVAGQLALDGMLECLGQAAPPQRLADYWLAVTAGLAHGAMDRLTFWLCDQADGSGGKTTLAEQRREHLEMWLLLGDPALRLPIEPLAIDLAVAPEAVPGATVTVTGSVPATFAAATVRLTLERPLGAAPAARGGEDELARHRRANEPVLASADVTCAPTGRFTGRFALPPELPWRRLVVRAAILAGGGRSAHGVAVLAVAR
jgi:hypothetical protein